MPRMTFLDSTEYLWDLQKSQIFLIMKNNLRSYMKAW